MRGLFVAMALVVVMAGCIGLGDEVDNEESAQALTADVSDPDNVLEEGPIVLEETYFGSVRGANAEVFVISPDQLSEMHREFHVYPDTTAIELDLHATGELYMVLEDPDCDESECREWVETEDGKAVHTIEDPLEGTWDIIFFIQEPGAAFGGPFVGEIDYWLDLTRTQDVLHKTEEGTYDGEVLAIHGGAFRISPDQAGDVYRELWVHNGTETLELEIEAEEDVAVSVGQTLHQRDRFSEEIYETEDGALTLTYEDPQEGGWYVIFFHEEEGPGASMIPYTLETFKHRT